MIAYPVCSRFRVAYLWLAIGLAEVEQASRQSVRRSKGPDRLVPLSLLEDFNGPSKEEHSPLD